jgi:hypothetical protein
VTITKFEVINAGTRNNLSHHVGEFERAAVVPWVQAIKPLVRDVSVVETASDQVQPDEKALGSENSSHGGSHQECQGSVTCLLRLLQ